MTQTIIKGDFMKKLASFFVFVTIILSGCTASLGQTVKPQRQGIEDTLIVSKNYNDTADLANSVAPAIVGISAVTPAGSSVGSGVCVAENGVIITNSHVVNGAKSIEIYLSNVCCPFLCKIFERRICYRRNY